MWIQNGFEEFFSLRYNLSNDIRQFLPKGQVWKRLWVLEVWSENGLEKEPAAPNHQELPGVPLLPLRNFHIKKFFPTLDIWS